MNLATVMDQLGTQLGTITGLRIHPYDANKITPPAAVVALPEAITFDETYRRGMDKLTLEVTVLVGKVSDRASRDAIALYANGSGSASVKAVLEAGTYTAMHTVRVATVEFDVIRVADVDYLAAVFTVDISGSGS